MGQVVLVLDGVRCRAAAFSKRQVITSSRAAFLVMTRRIEDEGALVAHEDKCTE